MPKIKFSTLVSDMKGKSNGSVFSKNSGGNYFRTNKSGGGKKSNIWNDRKNQFADLSTSWKALTDEQREAWVEMRMNYPTTNAFGDLRYPTGYELYMRLNGKLQASNLPLLDVPETPRTFPAVQPLDFILPDKYCFTPRINTILRTQDNVLTRMYNELFINNSSMDKLQALSCRFVGSEPFRNYLQPGRTFQLLSIQNADDYSTSYFVNVVSNTFVDFYSVQTFLTGTNTEKTYVRRYECPISFIQTQIHITAQFAAEDLEDTTFYVNGSELPVAADGTINGWISDPATIIAATLTPLVFPTTYTTLPSDNYALYIGCNDDNYYGPFTLSDFRYYSDGELGESCSNNNPCEEGYQCVGGFCSVPDTYAGTFVPVYVQELFRGYVLGSETTAISFTRMVGSYFPNECSTGAGYDLQMVAEVGCTSNDDCEGNDVECQGGNCVYVGDHINVSFRNPLVYGPLIVLRKTQWDGDDFYLKVLFSKIISRGKSAEQTPYFLTQTLPFSLDSRNMSDIFLSQVGNFSPDSTFAFQASLLDGFTGAENDTYSPIANPKKRVTRFKAGAELSGKCN